MLQLAQNQLWKQEDRYFRIVIWERLAIQYKELASPDASEGTIHDVTKKEFCRLIKGAELVDESQPKAEQPSEDPAPEPATSPTMDKLFEELDFRETPIGDLILQRRKYQQLDNQIVYEVKLGDAFLMSSMFYHVEVALSRLGLKALDTHPDQEWDVVVGGLGLGYTAVAALEFPQVKNLLVVDSLEGVIDWHEKEMVPLGKTMNDDERCRYVLGDFFDLAAKPEKGFDPEQPGRKFHAVLLDIDHSPRNLLDSQNAAFYTPEGLEKLASQLHPGGVFALWSDDNPDDQFMADLEKTFASAIAEVVTFDNPLQGHTSGSTVYVATKD